MFPESPKVQPMALCNLFYSDGTRCPNETGMTEPGIDADLCLIHRDEMETQRRANKLEWDKINNK